MGTKTCGLHLALGLIGGIIKYMKYLQNNLVVKAIISVVVLLILILIIGTYVNKVSKRSVLNEQGAVVSTSTESATTSNVIGTKAKTVPMPVLTYGSKCGFTITSPALNTRISFPVVIKGIIDDSSKLNCSWNHVENRAGTAQSFYNLKNQGWKATGIAVPIITSGGPTASTSAFTVSLNAYSSALGLTSGTPIKIVFTEQPALNVKTPDTFDVIVYVK